MPPVIIDNLGPNIPTKEGATQLEKVKTAYTMPRLWKDYQIIITVKNHMQVFFFSSVAGYSIFKK